MMMNIMLRESAESKFARDKKLYVAVKKLREEIGLSEDVMTRYLSLSKENYIEVEAGKLNINQEMWENIEGLFGLFLEEMVPYVDGKLPKRDDENPLGFSYMDLDEASFFHGRSAEPEGLRDIRDVNRLLMSYRKLSMLIQKQEHIGKEKEWIETQISMRTWQRIFFDAEHVSQKEKLDGQFILQIYYSVLNTAYTMEAIHREEYMRNLYLYIDFLDLPYAINLLDAVKT